MSRDRRRELIERIEAMRGSRVVAYVTGDRPPVPAQIGDDAVRQLYEHLRRIDRAEKLDLFIYSRGGAIDVPWRINTALRSVAGEWTALVPFRANSAATLLCLGADEIVLGRHGELGPIDPVMSIQRVVPEGGRTVVQENVSVEDVMSYVKFVQTRAGLSDQVALATALSKLTDKLDAAAIGQAYRTHSHIRDVARRMLMSQRQPLPEQTVTSIVETLAERVYAHGHAIGLTTAREVGLRATAAEPELERVMWELLLEYERDMKLLEPVDPASAVASQDRYTEDVVLAIIDSAEASSVHEGQLQVVARRQVPPSVDLNLSLNFQLPVELAENAAKEPDAETLLQPLLKAAQGALQRLAQEAVQNALRTQAPLTGVESTFRGGRWRLVEA